MRQRVHVALPDGFDDKLGRMAALCDRLTRNELSPQEQSRACATMAYDLRRMRDFNKPRV